MVTFGDRKKLMISLFLILLVSIGIGYAYITTNLSIAGNTEIASNTWDIHFNNLVVTTGSVEATTPAAINPSDNTSISYGVKLNRPKDFYEFTVDIVNSGSLPGKVNLVTISGLPQELENIVDYSATYTNGNLVNIGDILNGGDTKSIKVRVFYKDDITEEDLPTSNANLNLTFDIEFVQSEEDEVTMNYIITNLVNDNSTCIYQYTGAVTDEVGVTKTNAENVYFNRCVDKRNIIFNNMCWQMIRTTETGGMKMIYNGEPVDGKCESTRAQHKGIVQSSNSTSQNISSNYLFGSSFTYDTTNNNFTLTDTFTEKWQDSTYENLLGKFTCKSSSDTCTTLYQINSYVSNTYAYLSYYTITNTNYAQIGISSFNADTRSPAMVGYMFNKQYNFNTKIMTSTETMLSNSSLATTYWYAPSAEWGNPVANKYNLVDAYQVSSTSNYPSLVGKYTFRNSTETYTASSVYYIAAVNGSTMYYINLQSGNNLSYYNYTYTYGDTYTDNGNGTYKINGAETINRTDWFDSYLDVKNKYVCKNATNDTCSDIWYATNTTSTNMTYIKMNNNYKYANGFSYNEGTDTYTLNSDSVSFWNMGDSANVTSLADHHYTCWNNEGTCSTISYIFYVSSGTPNYINIANGKSVSDALNEMLYKDDVNTYNSSIKGIIDAWYAQNLATKTNMLEDTVYCNARNMTNQSTNGWNPNGGSVSTYLYFKNITLNNDLSCSNITDQFAVSNNKAKLTYPVALATNEELYTLTNNNNSTYYSTLTNTGDYWWSFSPNSYNYDYSANACYIYNNGNVNNRYTISGKMGIRLVVSLAPGTIISRGTGAEDNPFIVSE